MALYEMGLGAISEAEDSRLRWKAFDDLLLNAQERRLTHLK